MGQSVWRAVDRVGFIGLGKLGLPCAAAMSVKAKVTIAGFDINPDVQKYIEDKKIPYMEARCEEFLAKSKLTFEDSIKSVVLKSDLIFLAIQTPHEAQFEGITPVPDTKADFNYKYLCESIAEVVDAVLETGKENLTLVVISTVLPGTLRKFVYPILSRAGNKIRFCYNPFFIAMGQTIDDFLNPEFVLIGSDDAQAAKDLELFYTRIHNRPSRIMELESAELTKVAYNTFIGFKIAFANSLAEIVRVTGGNVDEVTDALSSASDRLISGKYLRAGMGDGGGCHPRDQIAMSHLAETANLSSDIFGFLAKTRDAQTLRLAEEIKTQALDSQLPVCILGLAYKPGVNLTVGSPALLLIHYLEILNIEFVSWDPYITNTELPVVPHLFFIATNHKEFLNLDFPAGSLVMDPWGNATRESSKYLTLRPGR
jgi:UDPglucose 6-dehydrogenase